MLGKPCQIPYINVTVSYMFFGSRKSRGNRIKSAPSCSIGINGFRRVTRHSRKWAPEVPINIYNYVGFSHGFLEKWKMGSSECFVLLLLSWYAGALGRHFGPKLGPCPKTWILFERKAVNLGVFLEIASRNHQYSLGFNWYFACGDDGKFDSKSTKILLVLCSVSATFPPNSGTVVAEVSINHWYVYIFCYFSRNSLECVWKIPKKSLEGSQKLEWTSFGKVAETLHNTNDILMFWKRDFLIFAFFAQSAFVFALKRNTFSILRKIAEFWPQNHQYCNGKTYISSFSESDSRGAELLVFTMPKSVFWVPFAKTPPRHQIG